MSNSPKNLRLEMPQTYAFIEACREAFGTKSVNAQIKLGMDGAQTFHAVENGIEVGTKFREPTKFILVRDMALKPREVKVGR